MSDRQDLADLRSLIRGRPEIVLDDPDLMSVLAEHAAGSFGENVVDLRGAALKVLETRRHTLEQTNRMMTQESQRNFVSVNRIHRAVIPILRSGSLQEFCAAVRGPVKECLRIDEILLYVEDPVPRLSLNRNFGVIRSCPAGLVQDYFGNPAAFASRRILLRRCPANSSDIYRTAATPAILSEALLPLRLRDAPDSRQKQSDGTVQDFSLMLLGSKDRNTFQPGMGTDLLSFFREAAECILRRWTV